MIAKTKALQTLMQHAMQQHALIPVTTKDFIKLFDDVEHGATLMLMQPVSKENTVAISAAIDVTTNLIYCCKNKCFNNFSGNYKYLLIKLEALHKNLVIKANSFDNISACFAEDLLPMHSLIKMLAQLNERLQNIEELKPLYEVLQPEIRHVLSTKLLPYHRWLWWSAFVKELINKVHIDCTILQQILFKLNFNTDEFIGFMFKQHCNDVSNTNLQKQIIANYIKEYSLMRTAPAYISVQPSVKEVLLSWLNVQLSIANTDNTTANHLAQQDFSKLNTTLSVPQLALFIRLMVDANILNEKNSTGLLKNVAQMISTAKTSSISADSLQVNYYTPNVPSKNILKEHLFNMLNLLKSY